MYNYHSFNQVQLNQNLELMLNQVHLKKYVNMAKSDYQTNYHSMIKRLNSDKLADYTLGPEAVLQCVLHALESTRAKIHYRVTFPAKLFALLIRILPSSVMDRILFKAGDGGRR
jgi:hypothetical protein